MDSIQKMFFPKITFKKFAIQIILFHYKLCSTEKITYANKLKFPIF